jgi:hypothetical protein
MPQPVHAAPNPLEGFREQVEKVLRKSTLGSICLHRTAGRQRAILSQVDQPVFRQLLEVQFESLQRLAVTVRAAIRCRPSSATAAACLTRENGSGAGPHLLGSSRPVWMETNKTILFVTHSIEEAIYLADRIVVMTYRPGTVKRDLLVGLPRMRDPAAPAFNDLKRELGQLVMEEQQRHHQDERRMAVVD